MDTEIVREKRKAPVPKPGQCFLVKGLGDNVMMRTGRSMMEPGTIHAIGLTGTGWEGTLDIGLVRCIVEPEGPVRFREVAP